MSRCFIIILINFNLLSIIFSQNTCEDNCGSGTLQEYWNGEVDCVCSLDCAGYGDACCNFYNECLPGKKKATENYDESGFQKYDKD